MRTFYDFDNKLRSTRMGVPVIFKRFKSLSELPFEWEICEPLHVSTNEINHFKELITKRLASKFAVPTLTRSEAGMIINIEEALEGVPECFRRIRPLKSVLKIGLNLSSGRDVPELYAMRLAAILAVVELAKTRGQQTQFDMCYGDSGVFGGCRRIHLRYMIATPTIELLKIIMGPQFRGKVQRYIESLGGRAGYRIGEMQRDYPTLVGEFDFVLDRIETINQTIEYNRILKQIEHLRNR